MMKNNIIAKLLILVVFVISFASTVMIGYAYFDKLETNRVENINIGDWISLGIPIYTAQEFYDFATKADSISTDRYYLANNLDFTGFSWVYNNTMNTVTFRGTLDGNGHTISNLTIYSDDYWNSYMGIFPRMEGGTISNLTLNNVELDLGSNGLSAYMSTNGLLVGQIYGLTNTISNITMLDTSVRGSSYYGTGGLVGQIENDAVVNMDNIKAINLRVFSSEYYVGGLVGSINGSNSIVTISDIDIEGDVYGDASSAYTGGVIGYITSGAQVTLSRAIVETTPQNTLETSINYLDYTYRYIGGIIGYNSSNNVQVNETFFTGSLQTGDSRRYYYVGTLTARERGSITVNNSYYSMVLFTSGGGSSYTLDRSARGVMLPVVNDASMPSIAWWNTFATPFDSANSLWEQEANGRLYLTR